MPQTRTQLFPSLSPTSDIVAYGVLFDSDTTDFNIMLGDRKTGKTTIVIQSPYRDLWPRFEKGGQSLIYFSRRDTNGTDDEIYRYNIRTKTVSRLTYSSGHDFTPHPSPNNTHIAFVSKRTPVNAVFIMDKDGNNVRRVSPDGIRAGHPTWGRDDRDLFVTLRKDGAPADIYRINIPTD